MSDTKTPDVVVTRGFMGLLYMQVCAHKDVPHDVVQDEANRQNPAGTENGWFLIVEDGEHGNSPDQWPVACKDDPDRFHYMLVC